jgi:hypothetical protein
VTLVADESLSARVNFCELQCQERSNRPELVFLVTGVNRSQRRLCTLRSHLLQEIRRCYCFFFTTRFSTCSLAGGQFKQATIATPKGCKQFRQKEEQTQQSTLFNLEQSLSCPGMFPF